MTTPLPVDTRPAPLAVDLATAGGFGVRRRILLIDGIAGAVAGVVVLSFPGLLSGWYRLPRDLLILIASANLAYGLYSLSLAFRTRRPRPLIRLLVVANLSWAALCVRWVVIFHDTASVFGLAHLVGEAVFVGGLACLEWRWRDLLVER